MVPVTPFFFYPHYEDSLDGAQTPISLDLRSKPKTWTSFNDGVIIDECLHQGEAWSESFTFGKRSDKVLLGLVLQR